MVLHRSDQYPLSALLLEDVQVVIFLFYRVVGVTQNDDIAGLVSQVLNTTSNLGEKRIGHIEHDQADVLTAANAYLACRPVPYEADFVNSLLHSLPRLQRNDFRPVEHVGHGSKRNTRTLRYFSDT